MKRCLISLCWALLLSYARVAGATVALDLTGPELAAVSDAIVHARVLKVTVQATSEGRVLTTAELEVIEGLKGTSAGARLRVVYPGGVASGLGMLVSGQVALSENTECVIFLLKGDAGSYLPSALSLGYFSIGTRENDGIKIARRTTSGMTLVRRVRVGSLMQTVVGEPRELRAPLSTVMSDIRHDIAAAKMLKRDAILGTVPR